MILENNENKQKQIVTAKQCYMGTCCNNMIQQASEGKYKFRKLSCSF